MKIALEASIHTTPAAIRLGGDGAYLTFFVPETNKNEVVKLIHLQNKNLILTIEEVDE